MTWLGVLQFANYLIPLLIIPYIVRVLGADVFGKVTYAQNIISYFTLIVNFGFDYSATREIAVNKENKIHITQIFWTVIKQKTVLLLLSFVGLVILYFTFYKVSSDFTLYLFVFLMNVGIVLFPTWFFQGMEEMGKMAIFNILIKGIGLILTVIFVKSITDYLIYPLLMSLTYIVFGIGALVYVIKHFEILYIKTEKSIGKNILKTSFPIFLNSLFVSLYTTANITVLGLYHSNYDIGIYGGAQKIIMAILMLTSMPINIAIFPRISREFEYSKISGLKLLKKAIIVVGLVSVILCLLIYFLSSTFVNVLLGTEFRESINLLKLFSVLPFFVIIASLLTVQGLYGMGLQRYAPFVGLFIGIFSVVLNIIYIPTYGTVAAALNWIVAQMVEVIIVGTIIILYSKKQLHEN
jgi:Membrane protein involved in the export of O-antigen and teichoic acid